mmetsp:Transcript_9394/g.13753  ORF Transcript_9394/g.13753 Transcript_9394/m.13753 type:complete len:202 (-) Transcript_9394:2288-2893(-)
MIHRCFADIEFHGSFFKTVLESFDLQFHYSFQIILRKAIKNDIFINSIQELRFESVFHCQSNPFLHYFLITNLAPRTHIKNILTAYIARENYHSVAEVNRISLTVCYPSVIKHLEHHIEYIRVSLFHLIEQNDRVRPSTNCISELSTFVVTNISRRSTNQSGYCMFLHVLRHVDTNHCILRIKHKFAQCFAQLSFTYTGRS